MTSHQRTDDRDHLDDPSQQCVSFSNAANGAPLPDAEYSNRDYSNRDHPALARQPPAKQPRQ